jgi:heme exporter protein C
MLVFLYWPLGLMAFCCAVAALVASIRFLRTRVFPLDSVSVASVEVGLALLAAHLGVGAVWDHAISGRWWDWNVRLTAALACGLLYTGYLILRHAMEEPTQRATFCAVFSIFAFLNIPMLIVAIAWWAERRPPTAAWGVFRVQSAGWPLLAALTGAAALLAFALVYLRARQEDAQRDLDSLRRTVHAF